MSVLEWQILYKHAALCGVCLGGCSTRGGKEENSWSQSSSCYLISESYSVFTTILCGNFTSLLSVLLEIKPLGGNASYLDVDNIQGDKKIYGSFMDGSLFASRTVLRIEIKFSRPKTPGTRASLSLRLGLSPHSQAGIAFRLGKLAKQTMPGRWGSWSASLSPRTLQVKTLRGFLRNIRPISVLCKELTLKHCWCHINLLAPLTHVPSEAKEKTKMISVSQFLGYSCSSCTVKAWPCTSLQNAI